MVAFIPTSSFLPHSNRFSTNINIHYQNIIPKRSITTRVISPCMATPSRMDDDRVAVGFTIYSERLNGRAAMIGFIVAILIELWTGEGIIPLFQSIIEQS